MAYDPEARETSNNAMIIGIIVLVLLVGGALAYFATRPPENVETVAPIVVDRNPPAENTIVVEKEVPVPVEGGGGTDTIIVQPAPGGGSTNTTTRIERDRIIERPAGGSAPATGGQGSQPRVETDVTVNVPGQPGAPASNAAPPDNAAPPAADATAPPGY